MLNTNLTLIFDKNRENNKNIIIDNNKNPVNNWFNANNSLFNPIKYNNFDKSG